MSVFAKVDLCPAGIINSGSRTTVSYDPIPLVQVDKNDKIRQASINPSFEPGITTYLHIKSN